MSGTGDSGAGAFSYNPVREGWTPLSLAPENPSGFVAVLLAATIATVSSAVNRVWAWGRSPGVQADGIYPV
ncbi:MAG: hypothetical protein U9P12_00540 [Verrucomicrobiota bacterium]|nr:hypothetical protein [Verrucomicrobiota bacterium]